MFTSVIAKSLGNTSKKNGKIPRKGGSKKSPKPYLKILETQGGSQFFENFWIKKNSLTPSKKEMHFIWSFQCKYKCLVFPGYFPKPHLIHLLVD